MKKNIKSLLCFGMLTSISPIIMIPINNSIAHQFSLNAPNNQTENLNGLTQAKINTDFPIVTIQKTGHDAKKNVLFFVGEGYAKGQETKFINDVKIRANALFTEEPYRFFSSDFNIYAVMPEAKVSGDFGPYGQDNNYFGIFKQNGRTPTLTKRNKFINFEKQLTGYLDEGGKILDSIILCNSEEYFGVSDGGVPISSLSLEKGKNSTIPHEAGHSFAKLSDEYVLDYSSTQEGPNRTKNTDPETVRWKEFFNFRTVGMIKQSGNNWLDKYNNSYIPSMFCKMNDSGSEFCEVCKHVIFSIFNKHTKNKEELYIANPFISLEHDWKNEQYYYELGGPQIPIRQAQNKKIDFRTVIQNYTNSPKKIELKLYFLDQNNNPKKTWKKTFEIKEKELKNIYILTENINFTIERSDKVFGQVIDLDTGKELANSNTDKEPFYDVNIQYKLFENGKTSNQSVDNITDSLIKVKKGNDFKIIPPLLSGYQYVKSDIGSNIINNINKSQQVTLYYKKITASKEITLNLLEKDGKVIQTKKQKIYENEFFKPGDLDFAFDGSSDDDKLKKISPPNEIVTYADANNKVLNYTYYFSAKPYIEAEDVEIKLNSDFKPLDYAQGFSYDGYNLPTLQVENNNVNTKIPGYYTVTYKMTDNENFWHDNQIIGGTTKKTITVVVLNADGTLPENNTTPTPPPPPTEPTDPPSPPTNPDPPVTNPDPEPEKPNPNPEQNTIEKEIKTEINRINSLNLQLNKEQFTIDEINKINSNNLFNYLKNWVTTPNFIYEIINFSKLNNKINFNIKVQRNSNFENSKAFGLNYEVKKENTIQQNKTIKISNNEIILFSAIILLTSLAIALSSFIFYKKGKKGK